jgi:hypothetical protein
MTAHPPIEEVGMGAKSSPDSMQVRSLGFMGSSGLRGVAGVGSVMGGMPRAVLGFERLAGGGGERRQEWQRSYGGPNARMSEA